MLAGETPFRHGGSNFFRLIRMHVTERPRPLHEHDPDLPPALVELVDATLAKRSADRPTADELLRGLAAVAGVEPPRRARPSSGERPALARPSTDDWDGSSDTPPDARRSPRTTPAGPLHWSEDWPDED
jgi:hypothetical protein